MSTTISTLTRADAETFLYAEAKLIDDWALKQWAELFTDDGEYLVPPLGAPDAEPGLALFLIYDDRHRLGERALRLLKRTAHAEFPHSKVRHLITNVVVVGVIDGYTRVTCNFVVYRSRFGQTEVFPGHAIYDLQFDSAGSLRIRRKRAAVDTDTLDAQRRISIIL
jgi:p-cumate 2,3-dioxygenase subunit beta